MSKTVEPAAFFSELGHVKELRRAPSAEAADALPWALLYPDDCETPAWPNKALPALIAMTPEDALEQLRWLNERWGVQAAHIAVMSAPPFLDGEGALETARLLIDEGFSPILRSPLDWAVATRLEEIGCPGVDLQVAIPGLEEGVARPALLSRILSDLSGPVLLSGPLLKSEVNRCLSQGAAAILIDY